MVAQAYFLLLVVVGLLNRFGLLTHDSYYNTTKVFVGLATKAAEPRRRSTALQ